MLLNVHQDNFLTIKEYRSVTENICARLKIYRNLSKYLEGMEIDKFFYFGLSQRTQLEMSRLNITTITDPITSFFALNRSC